MKRSEMLAFIDNQLRGVMIDNDFANQFLSIVEEAGMQPPAYQSDIYIRSEGDYAYVNEWEPEDA